MPDKPPLPEKWISVPSQVPKPRSQRKPQVVVSAGHFLWAIGARKRGVLGGPNVPQSAAAKGEFAAAPLNGILADAGATVAPGLLALYDVLAHKIKKR
jgi:hypothetical protein